MIGGIITFVVGAIAGTVGGIIYGKKNPTVADTVVKAADTVASNVQDAVTKK